MRPLAAGCSWNAWRKGVAGRQFALTRRQPDDGQRLRGLRVRRAPLTGLSFDAGAEETSDAGRRPTPQELLAGGVGLGASAPGASVGRSRRTTGRKRRPPRPRGLRTGRSDGTPGPPPSLRGGVAARRDTRAPLPGDVRPSESRVGHPRARAPRPCGHFRMTTIASSAPARASSQVLGTAGQSGNRPQGRRNPGGKSGPRRLTR
jgi:hypothetical protein